MFDKIEKFYRKTVLRKFASEFVPRLVETHGTNHLETAAKEGLRAGIAELKEYARYEWVRTALSNTTFSILKVVLFFGIILSAFVGEVLFGHFSLTFSIVVVVYSLVFFAVYTYRIIEAKAQAVIRADYQGSMTPEILYAIIAETPPLVEPVDGRKNEEGSETANLGGNDEKVV